ncbi:MAG: hypothetical protein WCG45_03185 [bacterium]
MSYSLRFKINLLYHGNIFQSDEEIAASRTIQIPLGTGGNPWFIKRHGDEFTLYGKDAIYLKRLIQNGLIENVNIKSDEESVGTLSLFSGANFYSDPDVMLFPVFVEENRVIFSGEFTSFNSEDVFNNMSFAYNSDDGALYAIGSYDTGDTQLFFFKYEDEILTYIEIPNLLKVSTVNFINDGRSDMYDEGNVLSTNLNRAIPYTHSRHPYDGNYAPESFLEDGEVVDGTDWFGSGSEYFTNMYKEGLFVLYAKGISIEKFFLEGEFGADGSGSVASGDFTVQDSSENTYTVYYKQIYDSGDPSINQLIIVPGTGHTHVVGPGTDYESNEVSGIGQSNRLMYFLFATTNQCPIEELQNFVSSLFNYVNPTMSNFATTLSDLNSTAGYILSEITDPIVFTDENIGENPITIGNDPGSITYAGNNEFFVVLGFKIYKLTSSGEATYLGSYSFIENIVYLNGVIYATGYGSKIYTINPITGESQQGIENKLFYSWEDESETMNIYGTGSMCAYNDKIYAYAFLDNWDKYLIEINPETLKARIVDRVYIRLQYNSLFTYSPTETIPVSIGQSTQSYIEYQDYYYYSEGNCLMSIMKNYIKEEDFGNMYAEWTLASGFPETVSWTPIDINAIDSDDQNEWHFSIVNPNESEIVLRIKLSNDDSGNWFYLYND